MKKENIKKILREHTIKESLVNVNSKQNQIKKLDRVNCEESVPVQNNPRIMMWLVKQSSSSRNNKEKSLSEPLIDELTNVFGPQVKTVRLEFMMKLWPLQYKDLIFNVYTANRYGTAIEVCNMDYEAVRTGERQEDIIEFLEELARDIKY